MEREDRDRARPDTAGADDEAIATDDLEPQPGEGLPVDDV